MSGKLTAEQVREAVESNSWAETSSIREFNDSSWQGIADELNSRAERTCELKQASWDDGSCTWGCVCSACDAHFEHETGIGYNYCPNCGAKIQEAVKR